MLCVGIWSFFKLHLCFPYIFFLAVTASYDVDYIVTLTIKLYPYSKFLLTLLKVCSIPSLMYRQKTKILPQCFIPKSELLGEKELLYNILSKFGVCCLQLINLAKCVSHSIRSFLVFQVLFNSRQSFGFVSIKSWN